MYEAFNTIKSDNFLFKYLRLSVGANLRKNGTREPLVNFINKWLSSWNNIFVSLGVEWSFLI